MSKDPPDIRRRSYGYSLRAIKLYQALQQGKDGAGWVLGRQYLCAATSVGANVEEAQSAESRPGFVHKYGIAQKEARESLYWLKLLTESGLVPPQRLRPLMKETEELFAVITGIILSTNRGLKCKG
jgi:four helix bundle protein